MPPDPENPVPEWMKKPEAALKHLEMIQAVITRMANNSFMVKGWCITLVAALLALGGKEGNVRLVYVAYLPLLAFWYLDGYFLQQERGFRKIYDLYIGALETGIPPRLVETRAIDLKITPKSLPKEVQEEMKRDNTIPHVMWSNTLRVFYGVTLLLLMAATVFLHWRFRDFLSSLSGRIIVPVALVLLSFLLTERVAFYTERLIRGRSLLMKAIHYMASKPEVGQAGKTPIQAEVPAQMEEN